MTTKVGSTSDNAARMAEIARQRQEAAQRAEQQRKAQQVQQQQAQAAMKRDSFVRQSSATQRQQGTQDGMRTAQESTRLNLPKLNPPARGVSDVAEQPTLSAASTTTSARQIQRPALGKLSPPTNRSLSNEGPLAENNPSQTTSPGSTEAQGFFGGIANTVRDAARKVSEGVAAAAHASGTPSSPGTAAASEPSPANTDRLDSFQESLEEFGLNDEHLQTITENATQALDGDQSAGERLEAGLNVVNQLADALPEDRLQELPGLVQGISQGLPAATEFSNLANTLADPNANAADKAQAALDFADQAGEHLTEERREQLTNTLEKFQVGTDALQLVDTLTDPDSSNLDKAKATIDFAKTAGEFLPEGTKRQQLFEAAGNLGAPIATVENALTLTDPDASLREKADAFLGLVGGLGDTVDSVKDIGNALDELGVSRTLGLGPDSTARKLFDDTANLLDGLAGKLGARIGPELLQSAGKALGKALPALGGLISGYDTVRMGRIAADDSLPGEIRYIAGLGAGINAGDTVLAVTEALGVGNVGLPANIALSAASFAADVATNQMIQDHENGNFNPSDELRAFIGVSAVATAPAGLLNLTNAFGLDGSIGVLKDTIEVGGEYAGRAAEALFEFVKDKGEEAIREAGEFVASLPGDLRDSISGAIAGAGDLFGDAAGAFVDGLGDVAGTLGDLLPDLPDIDLSPLPGPL